MRKVRLPGRLGLLVLLVLLAGGWGAGGCGSSATASDGPAPADAAADVATGTDVGAGPEAASPDGAGPADGPAGVDGGGADAPIVATDAGPDGPVSCQWAATDPCGAGWYCAAPGCGAGVCAPVATVEQDTRNPVCGCDQVTYWNASVAAAHGMAVQATGACSPGKTCGGIAGIPCPAGASCNYRLNNISECGGADMGGTCWVLPATCPTIMIGPTQRQCGAGMCDDECSLIKVGVYWYEDNTCPQ